VTREDFRREMGDAFDSISGSPSPALPDRVRAALVEAPEHNDRVWIAALAAAVITVLLVGVLLVGNPLNLPLVPGGTVKQTPSVSPAPVTTPTASAVPSPSPTPKYICGASTAFVGKTPPLTAFIDDVRTGAHPPGYDRLTIEFNNGQPESIEVRPQANTKFMTDPKGDTVTLAGQVGLKITIHSADAHTAYSGTGNVKTGYSGLLEVRELGDFEGYVSFGLGLATPGCYSATILSNPTRLVIDIQTP
jgi:hypothetical protein